MDIPVTAQRAAIIAGNSILERALVIKLRSFGVDVRVLCRSESVADRSLTLGASEAVVADLCDRDDVARYLDDIDLLLFDPGLLRPTTEQELEAVVAAAKRRRVPHTVFLSCLRPLTPGFASFQRRARGEALLAGSGLHYSVLQPAMLMQNIGFLLPDVRTGGTLRWPWDVSRPFGWVDALDVAEAAVQLVSHPELAGGTYELCGATASGADVASLLSTLTGGDVAARRADAASDMGQRKVDVAPGWSGETLTGSADDFDLHGYGGGSRFILSKLLQREPTGMTDFLRRDAIAYLSMAHKDAVPDSLFLDDVFLSWGSAQL